MSRAFRPLRAACLLVAASFVVAAQPLVQQDIDELSVRRNVAPKLVEAFRAGERDVAAHVVLKARAVDPPFYRPFIDDSPEDLAVAYARVRASIA